ncbi:hypothetical protein Tco_0827575, partial [Tanacetum coccineum]
MIADLGRNSFVMFSMLIKAHCYDGGPDSYQRLPRGGIKEVQMMELRYAISSIIMAPVPDRWVWTSDGS